VKAAGAPEFVALYEQYLPRIFRYFSYRVNDGSLAEDLTSAVFEKALTRFGSFRAERSSFATWLFAIARNTLTDHYRAAGKQRWLSLDKVKEMAGMKRNQPEEEFAGKQRRQRLRTCLAALSAQERDIVSLKFGGEFSNREIAGLTGLSESNVGTILYRVVRKLRDCFGEWPNG
jgi:RNA polymerase sigma-70 factor (ECF subfamily)